MAPEPTEQMLRGSCVSCSGAFEFPEGHKGEVTVCPHCNQTITLCVSPDSELIPVSRSMPLNKKELIFILGVMIVLLASSVFLLPTLSKSFPSPDRVPEPSEDGLKELQLPSLAWDGDQKFFSLFIRMPECDATLKRVLVNNALLKERLITRYVLEEALGRKKHLIAVKLAVENNISESIDTDRFHLIDTSDEMYEQKVLIEERLGRIGAFAKKSGYLLFEVPEGVLPKALQFDTEKTLIFSKRPIYMLCILPQSLRVLLNEEKASSLTKQEKLKPNEIALLKKHGLSDVEARIAIEECERIGISVEFILQKFDVSR